MADVLEPNVVETLPEPLPEPPLGNERKRKYPVALMDEYHALTRKLLMEGLSALEEARLQHLMEQISAIDLADPMMQVRQAAMEQLWREVEQLRQDVEALSHK